MDAERSFSRAGLAHTNCRCNLASSTSSTLIVVDDWARHGYPNEDAFTKHKDQNSSDSGISGVDAIGPKSGASNANAVALSSKVKLT